MADETNAQVSASEPVEREGLPIPTASPVSKGQPTSGATDDAAALRKELKELKAQVKGLQSVTDRDMAPFRNLGQTDLATVLAIAQKHKGDPEAIEKEFFDAKMRQDFISRQQTAAPVNKGVDPEAIYARGRRILTKAGITDKEAADAVMKPLANKDYVDDDGSIKEEYYDDLAAEAVKYVQAKERREAPANPAAVVVPGGGVIPEKDLEAAYRKEILAARGKGALAGNAIREKYIKAGLDVHSIGF